MFVKPWVQISPTRYARRRKSIFRKWESKRALQFLVTIAYKEELQATFRFLLKTWNGKELMDWKLQKKSFKHFVLLK